MNNKQHSNIPYGPKQEPWNKQVPKGADVSSPKEDPTPIYPKVPPKNVTGPFPKLDYPKFELSPQGLTKEEKTEALEQLKQFINTQHINFTGFQVNQKLEFQELSWLLDIHANNVGDPYSSGYLTLNTKLVERAVLDYFAALWNADWPHREDKDTSNEDISSRHWGYVMSMGSTEGNLYATYNARNYLNGGMLLLDNKTDEASSLRRGKKAILNREVMIFPENCAKNYPPLALFSNPNKYTPVAFFSEDSHYSVVKAMNVMQVKTFQEVGEATGKPCPLPGTGGKWPAAVPSRDYSSDPRSGTINVKDLEILLKFFLDRGYPPLIICNVGSTWKGAYDPVDEVSKLLVRLGEEKKYNWLKEREVTYKGPDGKKFVDRRRGYWLHVDGALGAPYLPFFEMAYNRELLNHCPPIFDFRNEAVMSICCSLHKWVGAPWPGGIYMTRRKYQLQPPSVAGYIGSPDTTLGGSRNAFSSVLFWDYYARNSYEENMNKALCAEKVAKYLETKLKALEQEIKKTDPSADLWIQCADLSLAVTFKMVNAEIAWKYTVDCERLNVPGNNKQYQERTYAHIYSMQSLDMKLVDKFIDKVTEVCHNKGWKAAFPEKKEDTIDHLPNPGPWKNF